MIEGDSEGLQAPEHPAPTELDPPQLADIQTGVDLDSETLPHQQYLNAHDAIARNKARVERNEKFDIEN